VIPYPTHVRAVPLRAGAVPGCMKLLGCETEEECAKEGVAVELGFILRAQYVRVDYLESNRSGPTKSFSRNPKRIVVFHKLKYDNWFKAF
jgi:hypothetical protein